MNGPQLRQQAPRHTAPYGFVPLSEHVFFPPWSQSVSMDVPLEGALSAELELELKALSPIFVRDADDETRFFRRPNGNAAIPGSTLRGLLRNLIEIATFGRMSRVNDKTYGVRDLHNQELYVRHMARILRTPDGRMLPTPLVSAGWLQRKSGSDLTDGPPDEANPAQTVASITPCSFAKVEYSLLTALNPRFDPNRKQSAPDKYKQWGDDREVLAAIRPARTRDQLQGELDYLGRATHAGHFGSFGIATKLARRSSGLGDVSNGTAGTLVFTGQPSPWRPDAGPKRTGAGNAKHHDFVFHDLPNAKALDVSRKQLRDFEFIHSDTGQQGNLERTVAPNPEWKQWRARFIRGERVPIFYLLRPETGELRAFGLAMMFRLAYEHSTRDLVRRHQAGVNDATILHEADFAETLFGYVRDDKSDQAQTLKGRVSVGNLVATSPIRELDEVRVVLGGPKASYYPNYLEQGVAGSLPGSAPPRQDRGYAHKTYMDKDAVVRGWKRYRPLDRVVTPPPPTDARGALLNTSSVESRFRPLAAGTTFAGRVIVHNVLPAELGALLWAISFGGDDTCLHRVGLAKSLGYGAASIRLINATARDLDHNPIDPATLQTDCVDAFTKAMTEWCQGRQIRGAWHDSQQITELRSLGRTIPASEGQHMRIDNGSPEPRFKNDFSRAKAEGTVLPSATNWADWERRFPRLSSRVEGRDPGGGYRPGTTTSGPNPPHRPGPNSSGLQPSAPHPPVPPSPVVDFGGAALRRAAEAGDWTAAAGILRNWRDEAGEHDRARKSFAKGLFWAKAFKRGHPDLLAWFGG